MTTKMIDLMLIRHYIRLPIAARRDRYQMWTLFLHCRPTWGYGAL